ncbi:MAG: protein kinase [Pseudomonadota bacterium]
MDISPITWKQVCSLLDEYREDPTEEKLAALRSQDLADEVRKLFDDCVVGIVQLEQVTDAPAMLGPYRLLERLDQGGMADVFLAERGDGQFEQQVVIKRPRVAFDEALTALFERERQLIADFSHPHLCRFLDGGVGADGQPYYVMEYVQGLPIDRYVQERRLDVPGIVSLIRDVGEAVAYAHSRAVLHRDLKPSNVLITEDGQAKLMDFGIAKSLHQPVDGDEALSLRYGQYCTLAYAAPEQLDSAQSRVETDVYQLALVLYELLTGAAPYGEQPSAATVLANVQRGLTAPSAKALSSASASFDVRERSRALRGDLDAILLTALRPVPETRFRSMAQFLANLDQYLMGRSVSARQGNTAYRVRKWVARHRAPVVSAAVVAAVGLGAAVSVMQQSRETQRAELVRDTTLQLISGMFEASDPNAAVSTLADGRVVVDAAALLSGAEQELTTRQWPSLAVADEVINALGRAARSLGLFEACINLSGRVESFGARVNAARCMVELDRLDDAEARIGAALASDRSRSDLVLLAQAHNVLGNVAYLRRDTKRGRQEFSKALRGLDDASPASCRAQAGLAGIERIASELEEAERWGRATVACAQRVYGDQHSEYANALISLGGVLAERRRFTEALDLFGQAQAILQAILPETHVDHAYLSRNIGEVAARMFDYALAERHYRHALATFERTIGREEHLEIAWTLTYLASVLEATDRAEQAVDLMTRAEGLAVSRRFAVETQAFMQARLARAMGAADDQRASAKFEQALALEKGQADFLQNHARLHYAEYLNERCTDPPRALVLAERAYSSMSKRYGDTNTTANQARVSYATALIQGGRPDEGVMHLHQAERMLRVHWPEDHPIFEQIERVRSAMARCPVPSP